MLNSVKIQKRQSEIRQKLAELSAKDSPDENETREMESLDKEYQQNETRYRAALIAEDDERREAGKDLETRDGKEFADLVDKFELRQVALFFAEEGRTFDGATAEVIQEMRSQEGASYQGIPIPWAALEVRAGETVASGTPDPIRTMPIIDRLFPDSVAARVGAQIVDVGTGAVEWPVSLGAATVGWQTSETGNVGAANAYATEDRSLKPEHTLGTRMVITRKALKQSGEGLEQAVRREMNAAMAKEMDRVILQGSGASGEPSGVLTLAALSPAPFYVDAANADASWDVFREAIVAFILANAANGPADVRLLLRPEVFDSMDGDVFTGTSDTEWDVLLRRVPAANIILSGNALPAPDGSPLATDAVLTTSAGGAAPIVCGKWGGVDLIRDPYTNAASGGLVLTALATLDVNYVRGDQVGVLTNVQVS